MGIPLVTIGAPLVSMGVLLDSKCVPLDSMDAPLESKGVPPNLEVPIEEPAKPGNRLFGGKIPAGRMPVKRMYAIGG